MKKKHLARTFLSVCGGLFFGMIWRGSYGMIYVIALCIFAVMVQIIFWCIDHWNDEEKL